MRLHRGMRAWIAGFPAIVLSTLVPAMVWAQSSATVPSNYTGPTVIGYCFYVLSDTVNYAGPITISNYFRFDAERAFRQYAVTQAKGGALQGTTCRWVTEEQAKTAKDQGFHATDKAGHPVKAVQTGWHYTPGSGGMNGTANVANTATTAPQRATARTAAATNGVAANTGVASSTPAAQGTATANSTAATGSGGGSIAQSAAASKQAITASGASAVTDTMSTATTSMTNAMQNGMGKLFHKKQPTQTAATSGEAAPGSAAATSGPAAANQVAAEAPGAVTVPVGVAAPQVRPRQVV